MVAVPLCGRRRVIGVAGSVLRMAFRLQRSDIRNLTLLAELVLGALKPEDEDRFAQSAQAAATNWNRLRAPQSRAAPSRQYRRNRQPRLPQSVVSAASLQHMPVGANDRSGSAVAVALGSCRVAARSRQWSSAKPASWLSLNRRRPRAGDSREKPAADVARRAKLEAALSQPRLAEPALTFGQLEPKSSPAAWLILLVVHRRRAPRLQVESGGS